MGVTREKIFFSKKFINFELKTFILFNEFYLVVENLKSWKNGTDFDLSSCWGSDSSLSFFELTCFSGALLFVRSLVRLSSFSSPDNIVLYNIYRCFSSPDVLYGVPYYIIYIVASHLLMYCTILYNLYRCFSSPDVIVSYYIIYIVASHLIFIREIFFQTWLGSLANFYHRLTTFYKRKTKYNLVFVESEILKYSRLQLIVLPAQGYYKTKI